MGNSTPILGAIKEELAVIRGSVPDLIELPAGCKFVPRCQARIDHKPDICKEKEPDLVENKPGHSVWCRLYQDLDQDYDTTGAE